MKYINQLEYPHIPYITRTKMETEEERKKGETNSVRSSGCGLCSAIMVLDRLLVNYEFTLEDAVQLSYASKANEKGGTMYERFAPAFAEKFGLEFEMTDDPERLRYCLRTGGVAVLRTRGDYEGHIGIFSHGGHYVTLIGEERDGRIAVLDPSNKPGKYDEEGRECVEVKNEQILLCDMNSITKEFKIENPPLYLFWRK